MGVGAGQGDLKEAKECEPMEIQITGKNIELTPELRQFIERKLGKLSCHLPNIIEQKVEIFEEKTCKGAY